MKNMSMYVNMNMNMKDEVRSQEWMAEMVWRWKWEGDEGITIMSP